MGSGKQSNNSMDYTSSEEIDQPGKLVSDDNTGVGRSYECMFCKRGFTNAQALGGHMNIHRKDKAKAKQKNHQEYHSSSISLANKSHEEDQEYTNSKYFAPVSNDQQSQYTTALGGAYMSYQVYFPRSNPSNYLHGYHHHFDLPSPRPADHVHDYHMDQSLSLRIGPPHREFEHEERLNNRNESDVDLELRLGHYP